MIWIKENWELIVLVLFGMSEALALIPKIKANSVFQLVYQILFKAKEMLPGPKKA